MLEEGRIVKLSNNKEYIILNILDLHNLKYVCLLSNFKPLEIIIATVKEINGKTVFEEVTNNDELDYVLSNISLIRE